MVDKTKEQLVEEIEMLRGTVAELEQRKDQHTEGEHESRLVLQQALEFLDLLPDATFVVDRERRVIGWNSAIEEMTGVRREDILGKGDHAYAIPFYGEPRKIVIDLLWDRDQEPLKKYDFAKKKGDSLNAETFVPALYGGRGAYLWVAASPFLDNDGNIMGAVESIRDISERKQAEEIYVTMANSSPVGIYIAQERKLQFVNPVFQKTLGFSQNELLGRDVLEIVHPEDRNKVRRNATRMLKGKRSSPYEYRAISKGRKTVWVMETVTSIQYGGKRATLGSCMDISEQKEIKQRLEEEQELEASVLSAIPYAVLGLDERRIVFASDAAEKIFGWKPEELVGKNIRILYRSDEEYEEADRRAAETLREHETNDLEFICRRKDGREIVCRSTAARMAGTLGEKRTVVYMDITEQKREQEQIHKLSELQESIIDNANVWLDVLDEKANVLIWNKAAEVISGYSREEVVGHGKIWEWLYPDQGYRKEITDKAATIIQGDVVQDFETNIRAKEGEHKTISWYSRNLVDTEGNPTGSIALGRDITVRKKAEERLEEAFIDLAETMSRAMESRDPYTSGHQRRVAGLADLVGRKLGLSADRLQGLYIGALLHDIGKVSIPQVILTKPGKLTEQEWGIIHAHAKRGHEILRDVSLPWPVADMTLHHHERLDGLGYPDGIRGDELSLEVRILGICDVVEAMSSLRPYRPARSKEEVLREIRGGRGVKYDADVVDAMLEIIESGEFPLSEGKDRIGIENGEM